MFNSQALFQKRLTSFLKETNRYLKYIFNGHIAIAMFFLISAMAVYYQQWLKGLPEDFPSIWIISIIFGLLVSVNPIHTLLKEPDLVFLIPAEQQMKRYFQFTLIFSYIISLLPLLFVVAAVSPLYFHSFKEHSLRNYLLLFIIILMIKAWNLIANWWMLKIREGYVRKIDQLIRFILSCSIFFFLIKNEFLIAGIITIIFICLFLYDYSLSNRKVGIAWDILVEKDQRQMQTFYRLANLFTDVPHLKNPIKKRQLFISIVSNIPFMKKYTYDYLYRITFIRSGDYLGMYVRLIIIGSLFIYFIPNEWMKLIFALLFIYLSTFQLMSLYQHYRTNIWLDIYPLDLKVRQEAVIKLLFQLTFIQIIVFSFVFIGIQYYSGFVLILVIGTIFNYFFTNVYVKHKLV